MSPAHISYFNTQVSAIDTTDKCLCIYIGNAIFSYVILNSNHKVIGFEKYGFEITEQSLTTLFENKKWLTEKYQSVKIAFATPQVSTVPDSYFNTYQMDTILDTQYGDINQYKSFNNFVPSEKLYVVYRLRREVIKKIIAQFPTASWHHYQSLLIANKKVITHENQMYLHFLEDAYVVCFYKLGQFHFAKTFTVLSNEDIVYNILSIAKLSDIKIEDIHCSISGWITEKSSLYKELYKFLPHLEFASDLKQLTIDNQELDKHFFGTFEIIDQSI